MIECTELLLASITVLAGSILSHSAIWYRIGKLEKAVYNGSGKQDEH